MYCYKIYQLLGHLFKNFKKNENKNENNKYKKKKKK